MKTGQNHLALETAIEHHNSKSSKTKRVGAGACVAQERRCSEPLPLHFWEHRSMGFISQWSHLKYIKIQFGIHFQWHRTQLIAATHLLCLVLTQQEFKYLPVVNTFIKVPDCPGSHENQTARMYRKRKSLLKVFQSPPIFTRRAAKLLLDSL